MINACTIIGVPRIIQTYIPAINLKMPFLDIRKRQVKKPITIPIKMARIEILTVIKTPSAKSGVPC